MNGTSKQSFSPVAIHKPAVAFFGFNRPTCTKVVFEAIRRYRPRILLLVADGPRTDVLEDRALCESVRRIMQAVDWECHVKTNFSEQNMGCKRRMASGIDWVFSEVDEAIFLEDDCVPCCDFFNFCAEMLIHYRENLQVMHVGGANFQAGNMRGDASYYFSIYPHVWGWASWRRAWKSYDVEMLLWPRAKSENWISKVFDAQLEQAYWSDILEQVYAGALDTWDAQWAFACWQRNGISIIPNVNLIRNIGAGPDATHTKGRAGSLEIPTGTLDAFLHPSVIATDTAADKFSFDKVFGGDRMRKARHSGVHVRHYMSQLRRIVKGFILPS